MADHMMPWSADETIISLIIKRLDIADNIQTVKTTEGRGSHQVKLGVKPHALPVNAYLNNQL